MEFNYNLKGKAAIVTGARTGIGQGAAVALAQAGADVVGVGHNAMPETAQAVRDAGGKFVEVLADLTKPCDALYDTIVERTVAELGKVDILINNAGIIRRGDSIEFQEDDWDSVMNINLKTVFFLTQRVAKEFIKQGTGGKIVNIASLLSFQGGIRVPSYTASKHGVSGITKTLANEWAKYNININAIAPGYIDTNNTEALRSDPVRSAEILGRIPAGRWGLPEDIGGPCVFLCTEAARYINGFTLAVDGGWLGR